MKPGTVLFFKNFEFEDGGVADKLLIVLNDPDLSNGEPYLLCKTTSRKKRYRKAQIGCHSEKSYFFIDNRQDCFPSDTWVLFENLYEKEVTTLIDDSFKDKCCTKCTIDFQLYRAIANCVCHSEDVEGWKIELIKRYLKKTHPNKSPKKR
jgi:hypothetical protein